MKLAGLANQLGQVARAFGQGLQSPGKGFDKALEKSSHGEVEPDQAEAARGDELRDDELESAARGAERNANAARAPSASAAKTEGADANTASDHGLPSTASLDGKGLKVDMIA